MRKIKKGKQVIAVLLMMAMVVTSATACGSKKSSEKEQLVFRMAIVDGEASPIYKGAKAMALSQNTHVHMETMEETQNEI